MSLLIRWTCVPEARDEIPGAWGLWFDLWAQAFRHDEVKAGRVEARRPLAEHDRRRVKAGETPTETRADVDARMFALEFAALLDGLSIQVALEDPEVDSEMAYQIAMRFAERELNLPAAKKAVSARNAQWQRPQEAGHRPPALNLRTG